jgi:hypothetical protein
MSASQSCFPAAVRRAARRRHVQCAARPGDGRVDHRQLRTIAATPVASGPQIRVKMAVSRSTSLPDEASGPWPLETPDQQPSGPQTLIVVPTGSRVMTFPPRYPHAARPEAWCV